jgi:CheY-like chemotaxis protein
MTTREGGLGEVRAMDKKARIFMVDDDTYLVQVVQWVFEAEGYEFQTAHSAKDALEKVDSVSPDLIILDVMMEDVVAGFRVLNALRDGDDKPRNEKYAKVPILMFTSIQQRTKMKFSHDAGTALLPIDAFLEKPVQPKALLEKVADLLAKR